MQDALPKSIGIRPTGGCHHQLGEWLLLRKRDLEPGFPIKLLGSALAGRVG